MKQRHWSRFDGSLKIWWTSSWSSVITDLCRGGWFENSEVEGCIGSCQVGRASLCQPSENQRPNQCLIITYKSILFIAWLSYNPTNIYLNKHYSMRMFIHGPINTLILPDYVILDCDISIDFKLSILMD